MTAVIPEGEKYHGLDTEAEQWLEDNPEFKQVAIERDRRQVVVDPTTIESNDELAPTPAGPSTDVACRSCHAVKPRTEFYKCDLGLATGLCRACRGLQSADSKSANPVRHAENNRRSRRRRRLRKIRSLDLATMLIERVRERAPELVAEVEADMVDDDAIWDRVRVEPTDIGVGSD